MADIAWADVEKFLICIKANTSISPNNREILSILIVDERAKPILPVVVLRGRDLKGYKAKQFLEDIGLSADEFADVVEGRMGYREFLSILRTRKSLK